MYKAPSKTCLYHGISISLHNHKKSWQKKSLRLFCQLSYSRQNKCGRQTQLISSVRLLLLRLLLLRLLLLRLLLSSALREDPRLQPSALLLPD